MDTSNLCELGQRAHSMIGSVVDIYFNPFTEPLFEDSVKILNIISTNESEQSATARVMFSDTSYEVRKFKVPSTEEIQCQKNQ